MAKAKELSDALVRAYEFRHFHDVTSEIAAAADDPDRLVNLLGKLNEWKTLESRAILEIIRGRLGIIDKFERMLLTGAPETAHRKGDDNMHDLIARFPWLLNPEWQVMEEERTITAQLREWGAADIPEGDRTRYDFLALSDRRRLVVLEMKRPDYAVEVAELNRLLEYREKLSRGRSEPIHAVMLCGNDLKITDAYRAMWERDETLEIRPWSKIFEKSRQHYERHRALLEKDVLHGNFAGAVREIGETRHVLETDSTYRTQAERKTGIGPPDVDHGKKDK